MLLQISHAASSELQLKSRVKLRLGSALKPCLLKCQDLCIVQERQQKEAQQRTDRLLHELHTQQQWDVQGIHSWLRKELQSQVYGMCAERNSASPAAARGGADITRYPDTVHLASTLVIGEGHKSPCMRSFRVKHFRLRMGL